MLAAVRDASAAACATTISSCGCTISSAEVFETSGALISASPSVDCIDISASGAVLVLKGDITGPAGGVTADGIHIMSGASNVFISGKSTPGFAAMGHATVTGFATGIQIDGSNAELHQLDSNGNVTNGVVFNAVTGGDYNASFANSNVGGEGILINGGSGNVVSDSGFSLNNNGVEILVSSNNRIFDTGAGSNQGGNIQGANNVYGFWIAQSSGNHIKDSSSDNNTGTGTYLGCFPTGGPSGKKCGAGMKPSKFNRIIASGGSKNGGAGLGVDLGDSANVLDLNGGNSNGTSDGVDKNKKCDHNVWMGSGFGTTSTSCIH
jgi:hypothetical protein